MRLLLDSHTLLWYALNDKKLSTTACALIIDPQHEIFMSPASYWEIAIKVSIGKLKLHQAYEDFFDTCRYQYGFQILPIEPTHTAHLTKLPFPPNHKDPFDRLLIAQAIVERMAIVSSDQPLDAYPVTRLW